MIAYLTDVEGRWDKLASFAEGNPYISLRGDDTLVLADGVTFVFGGDAIDRGPASRKIVRTLLAAKRTYGDRVVLLAGNRDLNKLRLRAELGAVDGPRAEQLRWILANTMGARAAFEHRATELGGVDDEAVVESFLHDLAPGGDLRMYLEACGLGHRAGRTLFLHGAVTHESFGVVPGAERTGDVSAWLANLETFYRRELATYAAGDSPDALIAYQAPRRGTSQNQASVVYGRLTDDLQNPHLPDPGVIATLVRAGITRLVVGHTPSGDCPAIVRDAATGFELVLGDNSYGRVERGSQLAMDDGVLAVRATTELDDGAREPIVFSLAHGEPSPIGSIVDGRLVKASLAGDRFLAFRGLPERKVEQLAIHASALR